LVPDVKGRTQRISGLKMDRIIGDRMKLRNDELRNYYSSPNTIRMVKSRRMRLAEHVVCMRAKRNAYTILVD
jgi:hypothetical protein